jgi:hypothetical protein
MWCGHRIRGAATTDMRRADVRGGRQTGASPAQPPGVLAHDQHPPLTRMAAFR